MGHILDELDTQFDKILGFEDEIDCAMCRDSLVTRIMADIAQGNWNLPDIDESEEAELAKIYDDSEEIDDSNIDKIEVDAYDRYEADRELAFGDYDDDIIEIAMGEY